MDNCKKWTNFILSYHLSSSGTIHWWWCFSQHKIWQILNLLSSELSPWIFNKKDLKQSRNLHQSNFFAKDQRAGKFLIKITILYKLGLYFGMENTYR